MTPIASPRLARLVRGTLDRPATSAAIERCELCAGALADDHRHVLERANRRIFCACRPCSLLFDHDAAGGDRFRLVPTRRERLPLAIDDLAWRSLELPVDLAFFVRTDDARVLAFYPSPAGAVESLVPLDGWAALAEDHPVLATLQPDVEALLVNRVGQTRDVWRVGVDVCFRLVAIFREHWSGISGGIALRAEVATFFDGLQSKRTPVRA